MRGGSWNNESNNLRCANRNRNNPRNRNNNVGFRCVRSYYLPSQGEARIQWSADYWSVPAVSSDLSLCWILLQIF
ncbi:MAG: SUMF1/EgtB/PvdO family nonheme iron enzyme [bacterium]|nr:MAG: SUMF1/EgtB/PvdO family nonheme iron enzyme [bacterium]